MDHERRLHLRQRAQRGEVVFDAARSPAERIVGVEVVDGRDERGGRLRALGGLGIRREVRDVRRVVGAGMHVGPRLPAVDELVEGGAHVEIAIGGVGAEHRVDEHVCHRAGGDEEERALVAPSELHGARLLGGVGVLPIVHAVVLHRGVLEDTQPPERAGRAVLRRHDDDTLAERFQPLAEDAVVGVTEKRGERDLFGAVRKRRR